MTAQILRHPATDKIPERMPPYSRDAEQSTLGSMLRDNGTICDVLMLIPDAKFFYTDAHQKIFRCIVDIDAEGKPVDLVTLAELLHNRKQMEDIGGAAYIAELWDAAPTAANAEYYAGIVRNKGLLRHLLHITTDLARECYDQSQSGEDMIEDAERRILGLLTSKPGDVKPMFDFTKLSMNQMEARAEGKVGIGLPYGFIDLDEMTGGMHPGELTVVAARPSVGKSALALAFSRHVAMVQGKTPVFFASLEMAGEELASRLLCMHARVDSHHWRTGKLSADEWDRLGQSAEEVAAAPIHVAAHCYTLAQIIGAARRSYQKDKIGLIIVDYIQLVEVETRNIQRYEAIGQITRRLKLLASDLNIPVIAVAQLGRKVEERSDGEPNLSDLRESGNIEQDIDNALLLYRPKGQPEDSGEVVCKVAKQRNGKQGYVSLCFVKKFIRFENMAYEHPMR